jgi:diguanylate cyclase (GGDEF)-like protein
VGAASSSLWLVGLTIVAFGIWRPQRPVPLQDGHRTAILAVPAMATITAVGVLVVPSFGRATVIVDALALVTLVLAKVRIFIGFRQVQRLSAADRQAVTDGLTGVGHRRALVEHEAQRLGEAAADERVALMLIDLDDFKEVNDALGHHAGDELLARDGPARSARADADDLLVRLGGDEFALVVTLAPGQEARPSAERILERLVQPLVIDGTRVRVNASAGIAESDPSADTISELLRRADVAMYAAKKNASSRVQLFDPQLDVANHARLEMLHDLDAAIANHEFVLHYQPKIGVETGATVGAEALVRWQHPTRGLLYPDAFLTLVEQSGLMGAMTRMVVEAAIGQLAAWRASGLQISVAVNLSASDLLDEQLAEWIVALLAVHAVPIGALQVEITESVLMTDPDRAGTMLEKLRDNGLRIAVDDYGTGYCALAYLRDLPIDELKIDRTFIAPVTADPRSAAIVRSTIELAHALDLDVVAKASRTSQPSISSRTPAVTSRRATTSVDRSPPMSSPRGHAGATRRRSDRSAPAGFWAYGLILPDAVKPQHAKLWTGAPRVATVRVRVRVTLLSTCEAITATAPPGPASRSPSGANDPSWKVISK